MKKTITLTLTLLLAGSLYAAKVEKKTVVLTKQFKDIITKEFGTQTKKENADIIAVDQQTNNVNDLARKTTKKL